MKKSELRITVPDEMKKQVQHLAIDHDLRTNKVCEILLVYALEHLDKINFK